MRLARPDLTSVIAQQPRTVGFRKVLGGCARIRTLDPLIKRHMLCEQFQTLRCKLSDWSGLMGNGLEANCKPPCPPSRASDSERTCALSPIRRGQNNSHGALRLGSGNLLALRRGWSREGAVDRAASSGVEFVSVCSRIPRRSRRGHDSTGLPAPQPRTRGERLRICQEDILEHGASSGSIKVGSVH
jgi:hypothetical protein